MSDQILVTGLRADTVIGIYDWERLIRQPISVDLVLDCDLSAAGASDRVEDTVDYKTLTQRVKTRVETSHYRLIETLACDVAETCLDDQRVARVNVTIHKPGALRHAEDVAVAVTRDRTSKTARAPHRAFVGVGSNIDPTTNVPAALNAMHERYGALRVSPAYRTTAVGYEGAPDFINLAVELRTDEDVDALHATLRGIEHDLGRERTPERNAPRTIDLDVLLYDDVTRDANPELPDPLIAKAPFVLVPLADIAGNVMHPSLDVSIADLRAALPESPDGVTAWQGDPLY